MNARSDVSAQRWQLTLDGSPVVVELVPYSGRLWGTPRSFRVGGVDRKLDWAPGVSRWQRTKAPLVGSINIRGHSIAMTLTTVRPSYRTAVRRNVSSAKVGGPLAFLGTILGGAALGGGAAASAQTTLSWLIYELSVDDSAAGSWVAKTIDGRAERWTYVAAGGALPRTDTPNW